MTAVQNHEIGTATWDQLSGRLGQGAGAVAGRLLPEGATNMPAFS